MIVSDHLRDMACGSDGLDVSSSISVQHLVRAIGAPLVVIDMSSRVTFLNSAAEGLIGRQAEELIGEELRSLLTDESARPDRALSRALQRCLSSGEVCSATAIFRTPYGPSSVRLTVVPSTSNGQATGAVLIGRPSRGGEEAGADLSVELLASAPSGLVDVDDIHAMLCDEMARVIDVLDIDLAVARFLSPAGCPMLVCRGVEPREARELLSITGPDDLLLYQAVAYADSIISDKDHDGGYRAPGNITSFAAFPLHARSGSGGCVVFGLRGDGSTIRQYSHILQILCNQINISLRNYTLNFELKKRNTQLRGLYETSKAMSTSLDLNDVLQTIMGTSMSLVDAENCFIFELDPENKKLRILSMMTQWAFDPTIELDLDEGLVGAVAATGQGILSPRADLDPRSKRLEGTPDAPSSMIVVPLIFNDRMLGVMSLEKTPGTPFDRSQYELIELFSVQASMAINNAYMFGDLKRTASSLQMFNVLLTHDVANFNSPIHGYLEMLLREPTLDQRQHRYVRSALMQSDNISELIADIRQMIAMRNNGSGWKLEPTDLVPMIHEALNDISANAVYEDIGITFQLSVESALVQGNSFLKGLFYNLFSNACKYGNGQPVVISLEECDKRGSWWKVAIEDHGRGIPDEMKDRLFKRFDQLDTSHAAEGHGIGLSVVAELVRRYGGRVRVEDRIAGDHSQGSRFIVLLPRY